MASKALGVTKEVGLPAVPDASTVVETVAAITEGNRVVFPQTSPSGTTPTDSLINEIELITGLAVGNDSSSIWMVDASDPVALLLSAGTGQAIDARTLAINGTDLLAYPEVGLALQGPDKTLRFIGRELEVDDWELSVLINGRQLPGGGFVILPEEQKRRYVAFYGHPDTPGLGVLGEQDGAATIERMKPFLAAYESDGAQTVPTFEIIATVASAGAGDDGEAAVADLDAVDVDDGRLGFDFATDEFVGPGDGDAFGDAAEVHEQLGREGALVSGDADGDAHGAGDFVGFEADLLDVIADGLKLLARGIRVHEDQHGLVPRLAIGCGALDRLSCRTSGLM